MTSRAQDLQEGTTQSSIYRGQGCKFEPQMGLLAFFFFFFLAADNRIDKHGIPNHRPTSSPRLSPYPSSRLSPGPRLGPSSGHSLTLVHCGS